MLLSEVAKQVSLLSVLKSYRRGVSETFRADPKKCKTSQQLLLQISPCVHLATPPLHYQYRDGSHTPEDVQYNVPKTH